MKFFKFLTDIIKSKKFPEKSLEALVGEGLLTEEEMLRIKKDRAVAEWEKATGEKEKKSKR